MTAVSLEQALQIAFAHQQAGRLAEAAAMYRQILAVQPSHAAALHHLGLIAASAGQHAEALDLFARAIAQAPNDATYHSDLGVTLRHLGRLDESVACFERALRLWPDSPDLHYNLGHVLESLGRANEAIAAYQCAVQLRPNDAEAHNNLASVLAAKRRYDEAIACFQRALALNPGYAEVHSNLGETLAEMGRLNEAMISCQRAVALKPDFAAGQLNLAAILLRLERREEAIVSLQRAVTLNPDLPDAHTKLAETLCALARFDEAIACCQHALALKPNRAETHVDLGNAWMGNCRWEDAAECYQRAIALKPDFAEAHNNLGNTFSERGQWDEAIACFRRAVALRPDFTNASANLGTVLLYKGEVEQAIACHRQFAERWPDDSVAHWNLAVILLRTGRYDEGWKEYERRWGWAGASPFRHFTRPQWDGKPAPGKTIVVHAEQGYGDAVQFLRYLPFVRKRSGAERVIFECPSQLARLVAQSGEWDAEIVARRNMDGTVLPAFDLHLPTLSLPFALQQREPLTAARPYLRANAELRDAWSARLGSSSMFRVGIAWAGSSRHKNDLKRSIACEKLLPLVRIPGVTFYSLQMGLSGGAPAPLLEAGLIDLTSHIADFADTAALMAELDLIISVDTAVAHLAGALGRPVWTLIPFLADWRWGLDREDTPWYPSMRLFRQPAMGNWDTVVQRVANELATVRSQRT